MVAVVLFIVNLWWIRRQDADQEVKEGGLLPRIAAQRHLVILDRLLYVML